MKSKIFWIRVFLLFCCANVSWCQSTSVLTWDVAITYRESASNADKKLLANMLPSNMLFNINTRSELKLQVDEKSLTAEVKLPLQVEPPRRGSLSKVAWSEYYAFFDDITHVIAEGDPTNTEKWPAPGGTIAINQAILWKPSENLLIVGNPTGYDNSVWVPSLMLLCYLAHRDISFIERISGVKFTSTTKENKRVYTYAKNNFSIRIFYHKGFPERMEIDNMGRATRVVSEGRFSEKPIGSSYRVRYIHNSGSTYEEVVLTLKKVETRSNELGLDLPLGITVYDYRLLGANLTQKQIRESLDRALQYRWRGKLLTEEELRQLAYQEGNLLPPETPRRRYSLWMFLPAIALFGLALLLYLRRRQK